jgi:hypothetical protein
MKPKHWLAAVAGALALGCVAMSAEAAPLSGTQDVGKTGSQVEKVFGWYSWGYYPHRRYYRHRYYYRPYFYFGPRYHRRHWRWRHRYW